MPNTGFYAAHVMKTIVIMIFVNSVNKFTPVLEMPMTMTNGLDATTAIDG